MKLRFTILTRLEIFGGYYAFTLPAGFYPDYNKHGNTGQLMYDFTFTAKIESENPITNLYFPENAQVSL